MSPRPRTSKQRPLDPDAPGTAWRLFLAVPLPPEVKELIASLTDELGKKDWPVRWTTPANAHLTLHFLGDTEPERAELLRLALSQTVAGQTAFNLRTTGLGVFPNRRRPRVLWIGLHGPVHRLETLQQTIGITLQDLEFPIDDSQFHPHITLGRVRNTGTPTTPLRAMPEQVRQLLTQRGIDAPQSPASRPVPIREVELVRSHLSRAGARYETIARFPLSGGRQARS